MNTDAELLQRYVEEKSEAAFADLVRRHVGLVYSVALRRVGGDTHLAEDVAQTVFTDLARKAATLREHATLGGWLYLSTHAASAAVVRRERRRKARELTAHDMHPPTSEPAPDWGQLRPVIDDAIVELKNEDREAVVLRFFEQRSFAEVGAALRLTEEAARKRVERALEKLRVSLERRGIGSSVAALGAALTAIASSPAPAGLGAKLAGGAHATASASSGASLLAWLSVALPAAAVLVVSALLIGQRQTNRHLQDELGRLALDSSALAALHTENQNLARNLAEVGTLQAAAATPLPEMPVRVAQATTVSSRPIAASVRISPQGTMVWNEDFVSLRGFIDRLTELKRTIGPDARLQVRADGASYSAITYVVDEARKAGIPHLTVEGTGQPADSFSWWWF
jgi:RNA polymerase sigma factor (sigma-70 family)